MMVGYPGSHNSTCNAPPALPTQDLRNVRLGSDPYLAAGKMMGIPSSHLLPY